jgi:hypothetical protein
MTLITGIFGMNVAGLPGTEASSAFGWVMLLILATGAVALGTLLFKKLFGGAEYPVSRSGLGRQLGENALGECIRIRARIPPSEECREIGARDLAFEKPGKCIDHIGI